MNPIQKMWLKVLSPLSYLINERLAKRSGMLGKIGKFFLIGPREYGVHPTNRLFIYFNRRYMFATAVLLHRYSAVKALTQNGYNMLRPYKHLAFVGPFFILLGLTRIIYFGYGNRVYEPDRLTYVHRTLAGYMSLPLSTMNQRTSGHFLEINQIYMGEMLKRYHKMHGKIIEQRKQASDKVKKTKFAHPSYTYVPHKVAEEVV